MQRLVSQILSRKNVSMMNDMLSNSLDSCRPLRRRYGVSEVSRQLRIFVFLSILLYYVLELCINLTIYQAGNKIW